MNWARTEEDKVTGANLPSLAPVGTQSFAPTTISGPVRAVALPKAVSKAAKLENGTILIV